jgi:hypothetical protein
MKKTRQSNLRINTNPDYDLLKFKDIKIDTSKSDFSNLKFKNLNYLTSPSSGLLHKLSKNNPSSKPNETKFSLIDETKLSKESNFQ